MNGRFFAWIEKHRLTLFFGLMGAAALFWYGYRLINSLNPVPSGISGAIGQSATGQGDGQTATDQSPGVKEPGPLKIPREYNPSDSLLDLKIERDRERSRETEQVQDLLNKVGLTDETRKQAELELWRLTQATAKEHELETLLKARGYQESMVTISPKLVTVVVAGKLDPQKANEIGQATAEVTTYSLDQIEIVER
ncbi:MAG TPA: SpoIIIAH-like family protein [Bacillota bacterium]|nr:SpoIIIAH-like family protein [Bacillota bacterium]